MSFLPSDMFASQLQEDDISRLSRESDSDAFGAAFMKRKTVDHPSVFLTDEETCRLA